MRYSLSFDDTDEAVCIYDSSLKRVVGDGKGNALVLDSVDEAMGIIDIMTERIKELIAA